MAGCEPAAPLSTTTAAARWNSGVQAGFVYGATSTSPERSRSNCDLNGDGGLLEGLPDGFAVLPFSGCPGNDSLQAVFGDEAIVGSRGQHESGGDGEAGAEQLAKVGCLPADDAQRRPREALQRGDEGSPGDRGSNGALHTVQIEI